MNSLLQRNTASRWQKLRSKEDEGGWCFISVGGGVAWEDGTGQGQGT